MKYHFPQLFVAGSIDWQSDGATENCQKTDEVRAGHVKVKVVVDKAIHIELQRLRFSCDDAASKYKITHKLPRGDNDVDHITGQISHNDLKLNRVQG